MPIRTSNLRPYLSLVLGQVTNAVTIRDLIVDLEGLVCTGVRTRLGGGTPTAGVMTAAFFYYQEQRPPAWLEGVGLSDLTHHLVVVVKKGTQVAVCVTDPKWRGPVVDAFGTGGTRGLGRTQPVAVSTLNAAFIRGRARTLWLAGTHRRSEIRADSKILSGVDLRYALDPLADQSFYFTSARSDQVLTNRTMPVGVTPRSSRVWLGVVASWDDFLHGVETVLDAVAAVTTGNDAPLPILAVPCMDATAVQGPFDAALIAPEAPDGQDPATTQNHEQWTWRSRIDVEAPNGTGFRAGVFFEGQRLGTLDIGVSLADPSHPVCTAVVVNTEPGKQALLQTGTLLCSDANWLRVWYDSGHTMGDGELYRVRHRDLRFAGFQWADFGTHRVDQEKPNPLTAIGAQDSLFCWIHKAWPNATLPCGWLACDDGAGEKADFIHLTDPGAPVLSLIHAKAAHSASANRQIAVAAFEVVVSQAVKNLRYLEPELLGDGIDHGLGTKIRDLVWKDRRTIARARMVNKIRGLGANIEKQVVVLQPHLRQRLVSRPASRNAMGAREAMLHTLLLSADMACRGRGASFRVVGAV